MKKIVLTLFSAFALLNYTNAQVSAYSFAQSSGTYTAITAGTTVASDSADDNVLGALPIGFSFTYNGTAYTQFGLDVNGWISMGPTVPSNGYTPISSGTTNNIISGLGKDLQLGYTTSGSFTTGSNIITISAGTNTGFLVGDSLIRHDGFPVGTKITAVGATTITVSNNATATGTAGTFTVAGNISYLTSGTSPNRVCVIQWTRARRYNNSSTGGQNNLFNFQIRLTETSNLIAIVYGPFQTNAAISDYQIGLRGSASSDFNNRKTSTDWSATTAGTVNTDTCSLRIAVKPASGQTYTWTPPPACTGTPNAGTASAPTGACSGIPFNLTLTGYPSTVSGITFQWESSTTSGGTYTAITGGTTPIFSTTQTTAMFYKCVVTCTASSGSSTSNIVNVIMNTGINCYCIAVHSGPCSASDNIDSVRIVATTLANLHTGCTGTNGNAYTIYPATGNTTATLNAGNTYTFKVTTTASNIVSIWIDYNQDGVFDSVEWNQVCLTSVANVPNAVSITIPASAVAGLTGIRIRSRLAGNINGPTNPCTSFGSGETEDYKVTIVAAPSCTGTPNAGIASAPSGACTGVNFNLTLSGYSIASGLTYQWKSSPTSGGTYTNIAGAVNPTATTSQTASTYYECVVTCTASGMSATTTPINVIMNGVTSCYCTPPASTCSSGDIIYNVTMATINNSTTCSTNGYSSYPSPNPTLDRGAGYPISVFVGNGGTEYVGAWIDYDQNGVFDASEFTSIGSGDSVAVTGNIAISSTASVGNTMMRIRVQYNTAFTGTDACTAAHLGYGEAEDYKVNIAAATGINENTLGDINIYPNPTTGIFNITANNANFTELTINVFDIQGKEVFNALDKNISSNYNKQINLEGLAKGIYFIKLNTGKGINIQKLVIQ